LKKGANFIICFFSQVDITTRCFVTSGHCNCYHQYCNAARSNSLVSVTNVVVTSC
jgi:hypothetical protein